jgi:hypothetical protein
VMSRMLITFVELGTSLLGWAFIFGNLSLLWVSLSALRQGTT